MKSHIFLSISILILNSDIKLSIDFFNVGFDDLSKYNFINMRYIDSFSNVEKYSDIYRSNCSIFINSSMREERDSEDIFSSIIYLKNKPIFSNDFISIMVSPFGDS